MYKIPVDIDIGRRGGDGNEGLITFQNYNIFCYNADYNF